jgi:hypothetical protein
MKTNQFTDTDRLAFQPAEKIGLIASVNPEQNVHITLITSIMAPGPTQITLGEFCSGRGKWFIQQNNRLSFFIMTLDKKFWRGKARWTHKRFEGKEYEQYNELPMFRYNTYFGVNTVHYLDLIEKEGPKSLPLPQIISAALVTKLAKSAAKTGPDEPILKPFAEDLFNDLGSLKFLSYLGTDGFPVIIPIIQCQAADSRRLAFSNLAFKNDLRQVPESAEVAVFCLNMKMQSVLIRGTYQGSKKFRGIKLGTITINWVYNSMPPIHEQIYPQHELKPVEVF